ncbi:MAG: COP23 domain-containing protein, partial [Pseudanabaena sp. ELA748]
VRALMTTFSIRYGLAGVPTLSETGSIPYLDVNQIIGYASPRFEIDKQVTISCSTNNRIPVTVVRTPKSDIPIIIWKSKTFTGSGWTPEKRCQEVSQRFENLRNKNSINYITSGVINELSVICTVKAKNEACTSEGILFTLETNVDHQKILKQMFLSNSDIPVDDNGVGKRDGRDSVCMSRSAGGNCSGLLISAIEL